MYTVTEFADFFRVTPAMVHSLIKRGIIRAKKLGKTLKIPHTEFEKFVHPNPPVRTFDANAWLQNAENCKKLERWKDAHGNPSKNVLWYEMDFVDFVAYYHFVVVPIRKRHFGGKFSRHPSFKWFSENGFSGFVRSFREGYLWNYGIGNVSEFFKKFDEIKIIFD